MYAVCWFKFSLSTLREPFRCIYFVLLGSSTWLKVMLFAAAPPEERNWPCG